MLYKTISYFKAIILCLLIVVLSSCQPNSDFRYLSGEPGQLEDFKGSWLIVNFWAEWCAPCHKEVQVLSDIVNKKQIPNLSIIGVSYDPLEVTDLKRIVSEWKFSYPVISTQPVPYLPFSLPKKLPALYILSPKLELVAKISGEQDLESLSKLLNSLKKSNK